MRTGYRFRKPYQVKQKKHFFKNLIFWLAILIIIIISGVSYLILFFDFFQIKNIKISGNERITTSDLEKEIYQKTIKNFLRLSSKSIFLTSLGRIEESLLKNFPLIDEIKSKRKFPDSLIFEIRERKPVANFCFDSDCFFIDKKGIIFEKSEENFTGFIKIKNSEQKPISSLGEKVINEKILEFILNTDNKLKEELKINIIEFDLLSQERLNVKTEESWEIYFDLKGDLDWQTEKLTLVLENEIPPEKRGDLEYVDLRFTRVYYKYKDLSSSTQEP